MKESQKKSWQENQGSDSEKTYALELSDVQN